MKNRMILFIIWSIIFITEIEILIANPSELSGFIIFTCSLLAVLPMVGMAECLSKFKKNQKKVNN
jgi:hypothetical protein